MLTEIFVLLAQLTSIARSFHNIPSHTTLRNRNTIFSKNTNSNGCKVTSTPVSIAMTAESTTLDGAGSAGKKRPLRSINALIQDHGPSSLSPTSNSNRFHRTARLGDIVSIDLSLSPENGYVPEHLFDSSGEITLVLGWGNYLPGLHEMLLNGDITNGDSVSNVSVDAGFGNRNPEMVIEVPKKNLRKIQSMEKIVPNATLNLQGGIKVTVLDVTEDTILVDANHPLAGSSYSCSLKVLGIDRFPVEKLEFEGDDRQDPLSESITSPPFEIATFAMGCFWGVELAFMRTPGVVGTRAGYTQGRLENPSYEEIREGHTGHREAVMVIYDPRVVSYKDILSVYNDRLAVTAPEYFKLDIFAEDDDDDESSPDSQYKHGIYFHNEEQKKLAREYIDSIKDIRYCDVELNPASVFYSAEEHHQQYLYKGGQAARKGCRQTIRCYG
jgi:methionine-S-sulfoxide reductase